MRLFHRTCGESGIVHDNEATFRFPNDFEEKGDARQRSFWD
ncbi:hypothetical protein AALB53_20300 [Lachnospiraceae bacterium 47-T17]